MNTDPVKMLSDAIKTHTVWLENINKTLICDVSPNETMIDNSSYLKCDFGHWLEENKDTLKKANSALFEELYKNHKKLHQLGKEILEIAYENSFSNNIRKAIPKEKYEELLKISKDIKKNLRKFRADVYTTEL
jgi:hypothetical protein